MTTSRFASLAKGAQVSAEALASAIAAMSADDLKGALSAEQLAALAPASAASEEDAGDKPMKKGKGKKDKMESEDGEYDDEDEPMAQDRAAVVFASEHSQGRERLAAECLASFPGATASQITSFLAKQPKAEPKAEAPEGTAELASAIRHNNSNLGEGGNAAPQADASAIWEKAIKANNPHINR